MTNLTMPVLNKPILPYAGSLLIGFQWMLDHDGWFSIDVRRGIVRGWGDFICFKGFATEENFTNGKVIKVVDKYIVHGDYKRLQSLRNEEPWHEWNLFNNNGYFDLKPYGYPNFDNSFDWDNPNSNIYNISKYWTVSYRVGVWEGSRDAWKGTNHQTSYPDMNQAFYGLQNLKWEYHDMLKNPDKYFVLNVWNKRNPYYFNIRPKVANGNYVTNTYAPKFPSTTITFYGLDHGQYNAKYTLILSVDPDVKVSKNIYYIFLLNQKPSNNKDFKPSEKEVYYA